MMVPIVVRRDVLGLERDAFAYPKVYYFQQGNVYTGSYRGLNYKIVPDKETKTLGVSVWYGLFCSTVSEPETQADFPMTEDGLNQSREFLWDIYCAYHREQVLSAK